VLVYKTLIADKHVLVAMGLQGLPQQNVFLVLVADFLDPEGDLVPGPGCVGTAS
jgi:hypothetical protein